nr:hypothetical transcript [Hymenolepis microstoma]
MTVASVMMCCACGFAAFGLSTGKPNNAVNQPPLPGLSTKMPIGSYTNTSFLQQNHISNRTPMPSAPYPTNQSHPIPCDEYSMPSVPYLHPEMAFQQPPPPMPNMPPHMPPHPAPPPPYDQCVNQSAPVNSEKQ